MIENKSGGGSATPIVGIIAVVALVAIFAWFFVIRDAKPPAAAAAPQAQADSDNGISIKVDLPDSVVIKP